MLQIESPLGPVDGSEWGWVINIHGYSVGGAKLYRTSILGDESNMAVD